MWRGSVSSMLLFVVGCFFKIIITACVFLFSPFNLAKQKQKKVRLIFGVVVVGSRHRRSVSE